MSVEKGLEWVEFTRMNTEIKRVKERVVAELNLSIFINGRHFATSMITPMMEKEYVIGYLFGQGIIKTADDIKSIAIKDNLAEVTIPEIREAIEDISRIESDLKIRKEDVFKGVNAILKSEIYAETKAVHSAGLFKPGAEPICISEDIGRHNALDKVIGYALVNGVEFHNTFATSTGRMVPDMVSKICQANIPIVATKTAVTKMGIEIGEKSGLTIIGIVQDIGMNVTKDTGVIVASERVMKIYTNPQRILCE